jgi:TRAP-type mannitol/chloroaromatic compound transport system permease small subunit
VFIPQVIAIRLVDIFGKQLFEQVPSSWFQALESTGFYCLIMLGAAYAYWRNDHVRVDIIRERLSERSKAIIEILGFMLLLLPVCVVVLVPGSEIVFDSIIKQETSGALMGTPTLWIFKAMILLCYAQLLAIGSYVTWKNIRFLRGHEAAPFPPERTLGDSQMDGERP